ncbi:MAG: HAD-IA family hydrolase [Pseudomonadota bacterium]
MSESTIDTSGPSTQIRAVLFDADGVLQRTRPGFLQALGRLCGDPANAEAFVKDVFKAETPCLVGQGDFVDSLARVLEKWQSPTSVDDALQIWSMIDPDPTAFDLIRSLQNKGTIVALATNQQAYRANLMLKELGYENEFDHLLCSCFIGHAKPSEAYFAQAVHQLDITAHEMLFIDDHDANVEAATAAGLRANQYHLDQGPDVLRDILAQHGLTLD